MILPGLLCAVPPSGEGAPPWAGQSSSPGLQDEELSTVTGSPVAPTQEHS